MLRSAGETRRRVTFVQTEVILDELYEWFAPGASEALSFRRVPEEVEAGAMVGPTRARCRLADRCRAALAVAALIAGASGVGCDPDLPPALLGPEPARPSPARRLLTVEQAASGALAVAARDASGQPLARIDHRGMRRWLLERRFVDLGRLLEERQQAFRAEPAAQEETLFDAYAAFRSALPEVGDALDAWVAARPLDPTAHLARAVHRQELGWEARGHRWASETSEEEFAGMHLRFEEARGDLARALELDPQALVAVVEGMRIARAEGADRRHGELHARGRAIAPASFRLAHAALTALLPRWGGSYQEMEGFLAELAPQVEANPRLALLRGMAALDRGRLHLAADRFPQALAWFDHAVRAGHFADYYAYRGRAQRMLDSDEAARTDFESALALDPQRPDLLWRHARTLVELGSVRTALAPLEHARQLDPRRVSQPRLGWRAKESEGRRA